MDEPVFYKLDGESSLMIYPVNVKDSMLFLSCCNILSFNKNEINSIDVIKMSYLQFMIEYLLTEESNAKKLYYVLNLCLKMDNPRIYYDKEERKHYIVDEETGIVLNSNQFEDIRRIIMYQNILGYDDTYVDSDLKKSIEQTKALKMAGLEPISLERKMAIITAHCGISKKEQKEMTYRSHSLLFQEVCSEVEYMATKPIALYGGVGDKVEWIHRKVKGKFDDYFTSVNNIQNKLGNGVSSQ